MAKSMYQKFEAFLKERNLSPYKVAQQANISQPTLSDWKHGKSEPKRTTLEKICTTYDLPLSYFYDDSAAEHKEIALTKKDERDIEKRLEAALADLENEQSALMFSGEPLDDKTRELLKISLENSIRIAKINAKKFTNKRYQKTDESEQS